MASVEKFSRRLDRIEQELRATSTQPRLAYSSIDGGALELRDAYGNLAGQVGVQWDGAVMAAALMGPPPPSPTMPLVTEMAGGLTLYWDGTFSTGRIAPMDFKRVTFHAVTDIDDFDVLDATQIVGESTIAVGSQVTAMLPAVEHFVCTVAWTESGQFSIESDWAFGTPKYVVDQQALDDLEEAMIAGDIAAKAYSDAELLAAQTVIEASITAGDEAAQEAAADALADAEIGIAADIVAAVGTITGSVIQTEATAARGIKLTTSGLIGYNSSGVAKFTLTPAGGLTVDGPVISSGSVTGATVTGGVVQTEATASRGVKITSAGLIGYNSSGVAKFTLTTAGALTIDGAITSGGTIAGAVITGGTLQTQPTGTNASAIRIAGNVLAAYNAAGTAIFTVNGDTGVVTAAGPVIGGGTITGAVVETIATANRGVKMRASGLTAYNASGVATLSIDGTTGALELTGTIKSGSTITGATLESLNGVTGAKAIISSGQIAMYSGVSGELASGGLASGSWVYNGINAGQTEVVSPRISANAASKMSLWQGNNGKSGAQLWASQSVRLTVDTTPNAIYAEAPNIILAADGLVKNTEIKLSTNKLTLDSSNIWIGGKAVNFVNPIDTRFWDYQQPYAPGYINAGTGWNNAYFKPSLVWPVGATYAHVSITCAALTDTNNSIDVAWKLLVYTSTRGYEQIGFAYAHTGGTYYADMGRHLEGWMYAPARGVSGAGFEITVQALVGGVGTVGLRATAVQVTFFS